MLDAPLSTSVIGPYRDAVRRLRGRSTEDDQDDAMVRRSGLPVRPRAERVSGRVEQIREAGA